MRRPRKGHRQKRDFDKAYRDFYRRTVEEPKIIAETEARLAHKPTLRPQPQLPLVVREDGPGPPHPAAVPLGFIYIKAETGKLFVSDGASWVPMN